MIAASSAWQRSPWGRALFLAASLHAVALGSLFVRLTPREEPATEMPAIAVDMAPPVAPPAAMHDVPTPRQIESPRQTPKEEPQPKKLPFDAPPELNIADAKPEVVLPPRKKEVPRAEKTNPLPPAPTTTEQAAPDLKPDVKTTALLSGGAAAGKASPDALWDARVRARVELTKRYPGEAVRAHQQDEVDVLLTMDRGGRLLDARIRASRGFAVLNDAALDAVRRAAPFPKPPKEVDGDPIRLSIIVRFVERRR